MSGDSPAPAGPGWTWYRRLHRPDCLGCGNLLPEVTLEVTVHRRDGGLLIFNICEDCEHLVEQLADELEVPVDREPDDDGLPF